MLKITLARTGKRNQPYFRIVVTEKGQDPWGSTIANLGNYNPRSKELILDEAKTKEFLKNGAQPSDTVHNLLVTKGLISGKKRAVTNLNAKKRLSIEEAKQKEAEEKLKKEEERKAAELAQKEAEEKAKAEAKAAEEAAKAAEAPKE